jgi:hypothetical protein
VSSLLGIGFGMMPKKAKGGLTRYVDAPPLYRLRDGIIVLPNKNVLFTFSARDAPTRMFGRTYRHETPATVSPSGFLTSCRPVVPPVYGVSPHTQLSLATRQPVFLLRKHSSLSLYPMTSPNTRGMCEIATYHVQKCWIFGAKTLRRTLQFLAYRAK